MQSEKKAGQNKGGKGVYRERVVKRTCAETADTPACLFSVTVIASALSN